MVTLILPMYNEQSSIGLLKEQLHTCQSGTIDVLIAVDDGSTDQTLTLLREWQSEEPRLRIVSYHPNRGLPGAVTAGLVAALAESTGDGDRDALVTMDADASHPMGLIPAMVQKIREGYDIVIASRHQPGSSQRGLTPARRLFSWGASTLMRFFYPIRGLHDYSTNYRAYRASLIKEALDNSSGRLVEACGFVGVVELLLRLSSLNPRIAEVPLHLRYDLKKSASKMKVWMTIRGYLSLVTRRRMRCQVGVCLPVLHGKA